MTSETKRITAYLHSSKEQMHYLGETHGLQGDALDRFRYALYEVRIDLEVNAITGEAKIIAVDGKKVGS